MKKSYLVMAAAAALFAACSSNDLAEEKSPQVTQPTDEQAVDFDVYVNRGTTRAGTNGPLTTDNIRNHAGSDPQNTAGFGVFGYYCNDEPYNGNTKPDFFYNQQVTFDGSTWGYSPVKYWPNEFGSDAKSDKIDRLTLFAYAPWVKVDGLTGIVTGDKYNNIISMSRNADSGDPFIRYSSSMDPGNSTDLCYGVAAEKFISSNSSVNTNTIAAGDPYVDVVKPALDGKIKFNFKHALAQLNVTIDAQVNGIDNTNELTAYTRIWVRSVTFEGIAQSGSLNLHEGVWYDLNGNNKLSTGQLTVYDGRKDGKEPSDVAKNETPATINPELIQNEPYTDGGTDFSKPTHKGVTKSTVNLFGNGVATTAPIFAIPTSEKMKVTIVYDVETYDPNLAVYLSDGETPGSTVENVIYKTIDSFGTIEAGKKYTLNLHLGMRSVDFEASVSGWDENSYSEGLPWNAPVYAALADPTSSLGTVIISASETDLTFGVSGLGASESVSLTPGSVTTTPASSTTSTAEGLVSIKAQFASANTSTTMTEGTVKVAGAGGKGGTLTIKQAAVPLNFTAATYDSGTPKITCTITNADVTALNATGITVTMKKDGSSFTGFTPDAALSLTPSSALAAGTYEVTIKANDADPVTQSFIVP